MCNAAVILACVLLAGCAGVDMRPGETSRAHREVAPGKGLFTGSQGEFVLYRRDEVKKPAGSKEEGKLQ